MLICVDGGLLTTVQDGGRPGAVDLGVPIGGACDPWSLAVANALLGNPPAAPALEMTLRGATLRVLEPCTVALAGAEMAGRVAETGRAVASGSTVRLERGSTLEFSAPREGGGARAYLALEGGVDVPDVLGSASTCLAGGFGGHEGRALRPGDVIGGRGGAVPATDVRWPGEPVLLGDILRVVPGPHLDLLPDGALGALVAAAYRVGRGDRQGIRLEGPPLESGAGSLLSEGVAWGAVQLPPDGQPIVLLADHQTVGGYPVVAVVISADRPRLGQLAPGDEVRFAEIDQPTARRALADQQAALAAARARMGR